MVDSAVQWARPQLRMIDGASAAELGPMAPKHGIRESDLITPHGSEGRCTRRGESKAQRVRSAAAVAVSDFLRTCVPPSTGDGRPRILHFTGMHPSSS